MSYKTLIKFCPHGINEKIFFPITSDMTEYLTLQEFKKHLLKGKEYNLTVLYNARNIRRKSVPDLMLGWREFIDMLPKEEQGRCALILHCSPADENGTDLQAVKDMLIGDEEDKYNFIFDINMYPPALMNMLYNSVDVVALVSSNEGWGLSLTEAMMCGKPIVATVTGGMQDQMRFEDENGKWIEFTEEFGSNHRGKYEKCGEWVYPIFPSSLSIQGSLVTPYIFDDRVDTDDIRDTLINVYRDKVGKPELYKSKCEAARKWVTSDESMMSAKNMCLNVAEVITKTISKWEPRHRWELIDVDLPKIPKHFNKYSIAK